MNAKPAQNPALDKQAVDSEIQRLVERAQAGDRTAFHKLTDRFQSDIYRMIYFRTRSAMDAEDLTQDVFFKAFRSLRQLRSTRLFRSWLYQIAVNRVRDYHRRRALKSLLGLVAIDDPDLRDDAELSEPPEAVRRIDRQAFWNQINHMLSTLPKMEKEVLLLRFFDDLSIREIAAVLRKNESTVKTHLYRALSKIKDAAAQLDGFLEDL